MRTSHISRVTPVHVVPSAKGTVPQTMNPVVVMGSINSQSHSNGLTTSRAHPGTPQKSRKEMMPETGAERRLQYLRFKEETTPKSLPAGS